MPLKKRLLLITLYVYTVVLFFPAQQALNFIATAALLIVFISHNSFREKKELFVQRKYLPLMILFFLLIVISILLSDDKAKGIRFLDPRLPLLYFPLCIGLVYIDKSLRKSALLGMAAIIAVIAFVCTVYGLYRSVRFNDTSLMYNDSLSEPVTGIQSIYVSLLVNIAIYILGWFLFYQNGRRKAWVIAGIVILFVTSFLLASRNLMLVLYISVLVFAIRYIIQRKKYREGILLFVAMLIAVIAIVQFFPKTINRFKELTYTSFDYTQTGPESHYNRPIDSTQWNGANTRLAIWQCGWQLFLQHPWLGVHLGDKKRELTNVYEQKGFEFAIRTDKNLHNNYLDILVSLGITGLVVFLLAWIIVPVYTAWQHKDGLTILIILTFAIAMITENYFDRSLGGTLFGFFVPFLLSDKTTKN